MAKPTKTANDEPVFEPDVPAEAEAEAEETGYTDSGDAVVDTWMPGVPKQVTNQEVEHEWQMEHNPSYAGQFAPIKEESKGSGKK